MSKNSSKLEGYAELLFDTLFNILNIKSKWYTEVDINQYEQELDYFDLINKERQKAEDYLKEALK